MERALGRDGFAIIELPRRNRITSDRFTEFADSFERYRATQCFEDVVAERLAKDGCRNGGANELNRLRDVCLADPPLLRRPALLLYDCDTNRPPSIGGRGGGGAA